MLIKKSIKNLIFKKRMQILPIYLIGYTITKKQPLLKNWQQLYLNKYYFFDNKFKKQCGALSIYLPTNKYSKIEDMQANQIICLFYFNKNVLFLNNQTSLSGESAIIKEILITFYYYKKFLLYLKQSTQLNLK